MNTTRHSHASMNARFARRVGAVAVAAVLAACSSAGPEKQVGATDVSPTVAAASARTAKDPHVAEWRKSMGKAPSPKDGCFRASYPSTAWVEVPCAPAPANAFGSHGPPLAAAATASSPKPREPEPQISPTASLGASGSGEPGPFVGGGGGDYFAQMSGPIYAATGSFPSVTGATGTTSYSLQLNSNAFTVPSTNATCPGCRGWQQGIYSTSQGTFIEYWLFGKGSNCPSGWTSSNGSCFKNSSGLGAPTVSSSDLSTMSMEMLVGSSDELTMTIEGEAYRATFASVLGLYENLWTSAEFGIFGDGGGSNVNLSSNTTIVGQIDADLPSSASCTTNSSGGATAETNNLNAICCLNDNAPGIQFVESNVSGASCSICGGPGQACCSLGKACASASNVCYGETCEACGGTGELCCAGNTCSTSGDVCQSGSCGLPDKLTASPSSISVANGDGQGTSINRASTVVTASGAWAGDVVPTFTYAGLPEGVTCAAPSGSSTVTCSASTATPVGTYTIAITGTIGSFAPVTTDVTLQVTACQPMTCSDIGYVCGSLDNGCGASENCGTCPSGESCTAGGCFKCAERTCPSKEFFNLETCECQACACGTLYVDGHYLCAVCKP